MSTFKKEIGGDRDLERILQLYEIIKRYELLVDHLLNRILDPDAIEKNKLIAVLTETNWNKREASVILGVSPGSLYKKLSRYGLHKRRDLTSKKFSRKEKEEYESV